MVSDTGIQRPSRLHEFAIVVDNDGQGDAIFMDFVKVFDSVLHHKLLYKLKQTLENDCSLQWIDSYLTDH